MTTENSNASYPLQLRVLGAFLLFFAFRDYLSLGGTYGSLREAGIAHEDIWNLTAYPREVSVYMFEHFIVGVALLNILAFLRKSRRFPWTFFGYYVCLVLLNIATALLYNNPAGIGGVIGQSLLCVPWLVYIFKSKQARNVFM